MLRDNEKTTSYSQIVKTLSNQIFRYPRVGTYILIVPKKNHEMVETLKLNLGPNII